MKTTNERMCKVFLILIFAFFQFVYGFRERHSITGQLNAQTHSKIYGLKGHANRDNPSDTSSTNTVNDLGSKSQCLIKQSKCSTNPNLVGVFPHPSQTGSQIEESECLRKAKYYHDFCNNADFEPTTALFLPTQRTLTYQVFRLDERIQMQVEHNVNTLCGQSNTKTKSIFYGTICANGNVLWDHIEALQLPPGMSSQDCKFSRETSTQSFIDSYLGSCDRAPVAIPVISSPSPYDYTNIRREWFKAGDLVRLGVRNTIKSLCSKSTGSITFFFGRICADGIQVQWHHLTTFDTIPGKTPKDCTFTREGSDLEAQRAWMGTCTTPPANVPQIQTTVAVDLLPALGREWYKPGDEVYVTITTDLGELCARPSGSATTLFGEICPNGNVMWNKMMTVDPAAPYSIEQCTWTRQGSNNDRWLQQWLGDCATAPSALVLYKISLNPSDIPKLAIDINECLSDPCGQYSNCSRVFPSSHICVCWPGYATLPDGDKCFEINACLSNPCDSHATCTKTGPGAYSCSCNAGYTGDGLTCTEIDLCKMDPPPCDAHATCIKHPTSYECKCTQGYIPELPDTSSTPSSTSLTTLSSSSTGGVMGIQFINNYACREIDNCIRNPCSKDATCTKTGPGVHMCQCKPGFKGDGIMCREINDCDGTNPCHIHATCTKTGPGKHECVCNAGYSGSGLICDEINNCEVANPCDAHSICIKTGPGTHECRCKPGYVKNGDVCVEDDPCSRSPCPESATCTKTGAGTFTCACKYGYTGNGKICTPLDSCRLNPCGPHSNCSATGPGVHVCVCNPGYSKVNENDPCKAIDGCNPNPCDIHATCVRMGPGQHKCNCNPGYVPNGEKCLEQDPCTLRPCHRHAACTTIGGGRYMCKCNEGYYGDGTVCLEEEGCRLNPCDKHASCIKSGERHLCVCNKGYQGNGQFCTEIDPCAANPCDPHANCRRNGPGTYICICNDGYIMEHGVCQERDSCSPNPCSSHATCTHLGPKKFKCTCKSGYAGNGFSCEAIDACEKGPCDINADCVVTGPGTYKCVCQAGFKLLADDTCEAINACEKKPCGANAICKYTGPNKFMCICKRGYTMIDNQCQELDPCKINSCPAHSTCIKTGLLQRDCKCHDGYVSNGKDCIEIDPCASSPCGENGICLKSGVGTYNCICKPGYKEVNHGCLEIDPCEEQPCGSHSLCSRTAPGRYVCTCKEGYAMDSSRKCKEVDPCLTAPCGPYSICRKTGLGLFTCTCIKGYRMDETTKNCVVEDSIRMKRLGAEPPLIEPFKNTLDKIQTIKRHIDEIDSAVGKQIRISKLESEMNELLRAKQIEAKQATYQKTNELEHQVDSVQVASRALEGIRQQQKHLSDLVGADASGVSKLTPTDGMKEDPIRQTRINNLLAEAKMNMDSLAKEVSDYRDSETTRRQKNRELQDLDLERKKEKLIQLLKRLKLEKAMSQLPDKPLDVDRSDQTDRVQQAEDALSQPKQSSQQPQQTRQPEPFRVGHRPAARSDMSLNDYLKQLSSELRRQQEEYKKEKEEQEKAKKLIMNNGTVPTIHPLLVSPNQPSSTGVQGSSSSSSGGNVDENIWYDPRDPPPPLYKKTLRGRSHSFQVPSDHSLPSPDSTLNLLPSTRNKEASPVEDTFIPPVPKETKPPPPAPPTSVHDSDFYKNFDKNFPIRPHLRNP